MSSRSWISWTVLGIAASGQTSAHSMQPVHRSGSNSGTVRRNRPLSLAAAEPAGMNRPMPGQHRRLADGALAERAGRRGPRSRPGRTARSRVAAVALRTCPRTTDTVGSTRGAASRRRWRRAPGRRSRPRRWRSMPSRMTAMLPSTTASPLLPNFLVIWAPTLSRIASAVAPADTRSTWPATAPMNAMPIIRVSSSGVGACLLATLNASTTRKRMLRSRIVRRAYAGSCAPHLGRRQVGLEDEACRPRPGP